MDGRGLDHVTLCIPDDGVVDAIEFYGEALGFDVEALDEYRMGVRETFAVRLGPESALHLRPTSTFEGAGSAVGHVAVRVAMEAEALRAHLEAAGVDVIEEYRSHRGASGRAPTLTVADPFGYRVALRARSPL